jgi:ATP-binding cassette subfamily F protein 3
VFVSHDRYFIDKLATRVIEVADGAVHLFPGNYEDYLWRKSGGGSQPAAASEARAPEPKPTKHEAPRQQHAKQEPAQPKQESKDDKLRRLNPIRLRQAKDRQRAIEDEITRLEVEIADFEQSLSLFQSAQHTIDISELLESRRTDMQNLLAEWEEVSQMIEANR